MSPDSYQAFKFRHKTAGSLLCCFPKPRTGLTGGPSWLISNHLLLTCWALQSHSDGLPFHPVFFDAFFLCFLCFFLFLLSVVLSLLFFNAVGIKGFFYCLCFLMSFFSAPFSILTFPFPSALSPLFSVVSLLIFSPSIRARLLNKCLSLMACWIQIQTVVGGGEQELWGHNCATDTWRYIKTLVPLYDFI